MWWTSGMLGTEIHQNFEKCEQTQSYGDSESTTSFKILSIVSHIMFVNPHTFSKEYGTSLNVQEFRVAVVWHFMLRFQTPLERSRVSLGCRSWVWNRLGDKMWRNFETLNLLLGHNIYPLFPVWKGRSYSPSFIFKDRILLANRKKRIIVQNLKQVIVL